MSSSSPEPGPPAPSHPPSSVPSAQSLPPPLPPPSHAPPPAPHAPPALHRLPPLPPAPNSLQAAPNWPPPVPNSLPPASDHANRPTHTTPRPTPHPRSPPPGARPALTALLRTILVVHLIDGRILTGRLMAVDADASLLLSGVRERRVLPRTPRGVNVATYYPYSRDTDGAGGVVDLDEFGVGGGPNGNVDVGAGGAGSLDPTSGFDSLDTTAPSGLDSLDTASASAAASPPTLPTHPPGAAAGDGSGGLVRTRELASVLVPMAHITRVHMRARDAGLWAAYAGVAFEGGEAVQRVPAVI